MKNLIAGLVLTAIVFTVATVGRADGTNSVAQPTPYPLDYCVVSGDKLGDMGASIDFVYQTNGINQDIKFCCPSCKPKFLANPGKYMAIIQKAEADKLNNPPPAK
jgi:hypothetical protein